MVFSIMDRGDNDDKSFCYMYIKQMIQAQCGIILTVIEIVIFIVSYVQFRKAKANNQLNKNVTVIYYVIFCWGIVYLLRNLVAQIVYGIQYFNKMGDKDDYHMYSILGKYVWILSFVTSFLIQTIIILVLYNWYQLGIFRMLNIVEFFQSISKKDSNYKEINQNSFKFEKICSNFLSKYAKLRAVLYFCCFLPFAVINNNKIQIILMKIVIILMLVESAFIFFLLLSGVVSISRNKQFKQIVEQQDIKHITKNYIYLLVCTFVRGTTDGVLFEQTGWGFYNTDKCRIIQENSNIDWLSLFIMLVKALLTHYLTILLILRVFKSEQTNNDGQVFQQEQNQNKTDDLVEDLLTEGK